MLGEVTSVTLVESGVEGVDLDFVKFTIDFGDYYMFIKHSDAMKYIGQNVEFDYRWDVYNGQKYTVITSLGTEKVIQTLSSEVSLTTSKLFSNENTRAMCTLDLKDLKVGETKYNTVALYLGYTKGVSSKAKWVDLQLTDMRGEYFTMKYFTTRVSDSDVDQLLDASEVSYARFDIASTQYGYQTQSVEFLDAVVQTSPQAMIAKGMIETVLSTDLEMKEVVENYNLLDTLQYKVDTDLGYPLVYLAAELAMINTISNLTDNYDIKLLNRIAIMSRLHYLPTKAAYSRGSTNVNKVLRSKLQNDTKLLQCLDVLSDVDYPEKSMFLEISKFSRSIVNRGRVQNEEDSFKFNIDDMRSKYGGLF